MVDIMGIYEDFMFLEKYKNLTELYMRVKLWFISFGLSLEGFVNFLSNENYIIASNT
jgi:hypothetical protein